jgi:hypothetical protein
MLGRKRLFFCGGLLIALPFLRIILFATQSEQTTLGYGFSRFEGIIYINLDSRTDRKTHVLEQMRKAGVPMDRVHRLSAVRPGSEEGRRSGRKGLLGCALSHIKAMDWAIAQGWKNVLVFEDDVRFKLPATKLQDQIERFFENNALRYGSAAWDTILLAGGNYRRNSQVLSSNGETLVVRRAFKAETTSAYAVDGHYFRTLRQNLIDGSKLCAVDCTRKLAALDQYWEHLQKVDNWYIFHPTLAMQNASYSDIENTHIPKGYRDGYR